MVVIWQPPTETAERLPTVGFFPFFFPFFLLLILFILSIQKDLPTALSFLLYHLCAITGLANHKEIIKLLVPQQKNNNKKTTASSKPAEEFTVKLWHYKP